MARETAMVEVEFRVAAYSRVSTTMQAKDGSSMDAQREILRRHIEYRNSLGNGKWELVGSYEEAGLSGKNTRRPKLQEMLADIRQGVVNVVLVTKLDRISRSLSDLHRLIEFFKDHNVRFVSLGDNVDTANDGGAAGRFTFNIIGSVAEFERAIIAERVRQTMEWRAEDGQWNGGRLLGYEYRDKRLVPVDEERVIVEAIYSTYLRTNSLRATAREMNAMGYRTKQYVSRREIHHGGEPFTKNAIYWILQNPTYAGRIRFKENTFDGKHEAIVDPDMFDEVQKRLEFNGLHPKRRRDKPKFTFMLDGLVRCGCCSASLSPSWSVGRSKTYRYYVCLSDRDNGGCEISRVNADELENTVANRLRTLAEDERLLDAVLAKHNRADEAQVEAHQHKLRVAMKARAEADSQLKNLVDFLADGGDSSAVKKRLRDLELLRDQLDSQVQTERAALTKLQNHTVTTSGAKYGLDMLNRAYEAATPEQRRELVHLLVDEITFHQDRIKMALYEVAPSTGPDLVAATNQTGSNDGLGWWTRGDSNP